MNRYDVNGPLRSIQYRAPDVVVEEGHVLRSMLGRAVYRILEARQPRIVWHLTAVRIDPEEVTPEDVVHPIYWHRSRRKARH